MAESFKLGFFRGVDFNNQIGASDWRIALHMPEYGFETWVYGRGKERESNIDSENLHLIGFNNLNIPFLNGLYMSVRYALHAVRNNIDVVICNQGVYLAAIIFKLINPESKVILDIRSIPVETNRFMEFSLNLSYKFIFKSRFFDAITIISDGMCNELDDRFHFKKYLPYFVWSSGYDERIFTGSNDISIPKEGRSSEFPFVIMFHGSLSPNRGLFELVRAVKLIKERGYNNVKLVLVGQGSATTALKHLVQELHISEMVSFLPPVPHIRVPSLLASADLGTDLLPNLPWWRYQSSLKVFEYLAMGKPVLATNIPCHKEISKAVFLIENNNPSTIAEAVISYQRLADSERQNIKKIALEDSKKHTWKARAEGLASFIRENKQNHQPSNF